MEAAYSVNELAEVVNRWCEENQVRPASGQVGVRITERNIRFYRTLGLVDPPVCGGGHGYGEKHRLQLVAVRLLQAQGLPLSRIQPLLFGRTGDELKEIEQRGLAELDTAHVAAFRPSGIENWGVAMLDDEFMLVSRYGRALPSGVLEEVRAVLKQRLANHRRIDGTGKEQ